ncbi:extracellular solute-binding protein [Georgenia halophila]|uniref:Extracellular solute-binding protein n=1 Tax=Georgenia halophila TaxID=620889 RepID=A0ABP8LL56_9MICO
MNDMNRRSFMKTTGLGVLGASVLAACGEGSSSAQGGGTTEVRFAWWGGTERQQMYNDALDLFEKQNSGITVLPEFADYDAYQERMVTQMAAGDVPEVFWIPSAQVLTYHAAGLYRPLDDLEALDLSDFSEADLESFKLHGELNTMPKSLSSPALRYNQTFLEDEGLEMLPDDEGWTWDALSEYLIDYTNNNAQGRKGTTYNAQTDLCFEAWLRQHGQQLWTADGEAGFDVDGVAGWFEWWETLRKAGAATSLSEQEGPAPEWPVVGDKVLATFGNSNHIADEAAMYPDYEFLLRRMPVLPDAEAGHRFIYLSRLAMYQDTEDSRIEATAKLIDFNINASDMLQIVGLSAGAPPNPRLLQEAYETATPDEEKMLAIIEEEQAAERRPRYESPAGSSTWRIIMTRGVEEVALERSSISDAATRVVEDIRAALAEAR